MQQITLLAALRARSSASRLAVWRREPIERRPIGRLLLASSLEDKEAAGVGDAANEADEVVSADVAVVARCGDDRADDGGESHGEPREGVGVAVEASLSLVATDSQDRADVAFSACPQVGKAGREHIEGDQTNRQYVLAADPGGGRQGTSADGEDGGGGPSMAPCLRLRHDVSSWSEMITASTIFPKLRGER